jgi:hypothetical protein
MSYYQCDYNTLAHLLQQQYAIHQPQYRTIPLHVQNPSYVQSHPHVNLPNLYPIHNINQPLQHIPQQQPYIVYVLMQMPFENRAESCYVPVLFNSPQYPILPMEYGIMYNQQQQQQQQQQPPFPPEPPRKKN